MDITLGRRPEKRIPKPPYQLQMKGKMGHIYMEGNVLFNPCNLNMLRVYLTLDDYLFIYLCRAYFSFTFSRK
jgi:hypothetical protein